MKKVIKDKDTKIKKDLMRSLKGIFIDTSKSPIKKDSSQILNELRYGRCSC